MDERQPRARARTAPGAMGGPVRPTSQRVRAVFQALRAPERRAAILALLVVLGVLVVIGRLAYEIQPWKDPANISRFLDGMGAFGPIIYATLIALAVIIPPIPDTIPVVMAGAGFGAVQGIVYSMIGMTVGTTVSFYVARRFGRQLLERHVTRGAIQRVDRHVAKMGWRVLFAGSLLGANSGLISYAAGLANMSFVAFFSAVFLGVLPQVVIITATGAAWHEQSVLLFVAVVGLMLVMAAVRATSGYVKARRARHRDGTS